MDEIAIVRYKRYREDRRLWMEEQKNKCKFEMTVRYQIELKRNISTER